MKIPERLRMLVDLGARVAHENAQKVWRDPLHVGKFDTCPHPDCVMARALESAPDYALSFAGVGK